MATLRVFPASALLTFWCIAAPGQPQTPFAATQMASKLTATTGQLNGMAVPNGLPTTAWYEWGERGGFSKATQPVVVGAGYAVVPISAMVTNLTLWRVYQCRLVVSNSAAVASGATHLFTTGKRVLAWQNNGVLDESLPGDATNIIAVAGNGALKLALRSGGTILEWGSSELAPALTDAVAIAASGDYRLALRSGGTVDGWDLNGSYSTGLSNVCAIAAADGFSVALKYDGTIISWGTGALSWPPPVDFTNVVALAAAGQHCLALKADGTVAGWGDDTQGQTTTPTNLSNVVAVAAGMGHSLALKADGTVVAWGDNFWGQTRVPSGLSHVVAIAGGEMSSLALLQDGTVTSWGGEVFGASQLPLGLSNVVGIADCGSPGGGLAIVPNVWPRTTSQVVSAPANVDQIIVLGGADPEDDRLALKVTSLPDQGQLYQCDNGLRGRLITLPGTLVTDPNRRIVFAPATNGFGSPYTVFGFTALGPQSQFPLMTVTVNVLGRAQAYTHPPTDIRSDSAYMNGMAVPNGLSTIAWFEWGLRGDRTNFTSPKDLGAVTQVLHVSSMAAPLERWSSYQCRLVVSNAAGIVRGPIQWFTTGQRALAWGDDYYGQSDVPLGLTNVCAVSAGWYHSLALQIGGTVVGWGNLFPPPGLSNAVAISSGSYHSLALLSDGTVAAWGAGTFVSDSDGFDYGQSIVPAAATGIVAIAAGGHHSLALTATGTVLGWGDTNSGAVNVPPGLSNVVAIAAGWGHSLALRADGTIAAWGADAQRETSVPQGLSNVVALAAGYWQSMALRDNGTVVTWGGSTSFPVPGLTNVVSIAQGADHHLALRQDETVVAWGSQTNVPSTVTNASSVSGGQSFSLALVPNHPPVALDQVVSGPANLPLPLFLRGQDFERDALAFHVVSLPSQGTLYQYSDAGRGPQIINPGTLVTDPQGRVLFEPLPDGFGLPYSTFRFTANDGEIESSPATVSINLAFPKCFSLPSTSEGFSAVSLTGFAIPNGLPSEAWFEWCSIGSTLTSTVPMDVGRSLTPIYVSSSLQGLKPQLAYHARLVVSNAAGIAYGPFQSFTTGFRIAAWGTNSSGQISVPHGLTNIISLATGARHSLCLDSDGSVVGWGDNSSGQASIPAGLPRVTAIAAGAAHNLALLSDGALIGWGDNTQLQATVPAGLTNIVGIAAGGSNSIVLRRNGLLAEWGDNRFGQCQVPIGLSNVVAVSIGAGHSAAVTIDGNLVAWGNNAYGQTNVPAGATNVIAVAAGDNHTLALLAGGAVLAWGENDRGQCSVPVGLTNVVAIAAGGSHSIAVRGDGVVFAWGDNRAGQATVPLGLRDVIAVEAGQLHTLALAPNVPSLVFSDSLVGLANRDLLVPLRAVDPNEDLLSFRITSLPRHGKLYQSLGGVRGQAITATDTYVTDPSNGVIFVPETNGFGSPYDAFSFVANDGFVDSAPATVTLVIGDFRAFTQSATAIGPTDATLNGMGIPSGFPSVAWFEWGPDNSFLSASPPVQLGSGMSVQRVSVRITGLVDGADYNCRLVVSNVAGITYGAVQRFSTGKYIAAWGMWTAGQTNIPIGIGKFTSVAAGLSHSVALRQNGSVFAWGSGTSQTNVPAGLNNVVGIAAGGQQSLALKADGSVAAWGVSSSVPPAATNAIAAATAGSSSLVLRSDGTIVAWGQSGQAPVGLSNVVAIAAGAYHCLALKVDGTVIAWGLDTYGQTDTPADLRDVVALAAGDNHSLALTRNGTVIGWGLSAQGQAAPPVGLSNVIAIAAGSAHSLALKSDGSVVAWGDPSQGRLAVPPLLTNVVAIAAGTAHSLALGTLWRPPYAHTQFATRLRPTSAVLNGMSLPGGLAASAWFEWGSRGAYSQSSPATAVEESDTVVRISSPIGGLQLGGVYQCRLVCSNAAGLAYGAPQIFTTGKKITVWGPNGSPQLVSNAVQVAGFYGEIAVDSGGRLTTWGSSSQPPPDVLTNVVQAGVNTYGGFALLENNILRTWGTGMASSTSNIIAAAVAYEHGVALRSDGTVLAFGLPGALPPFVSAPQTNVPAGLQNVVQVAVGDFHSVALRADGTVVAWGTDVYGPATKVPSGLSNIVAVAAGGSHNLALKSDGTLVAWGDNDFGQGNVPSGVSNVVAISAGWLHNLVLKEDGSALAWGDPVDAVPVALANVASVACGALFSMAIADNLGPSASVMTVSGAANHDLIVTLKGRDLNADPVVFKVESLPIQGSLYQYSAGTRGLAINQSGVVITDSGHRVIFVPASNQSGSPYTSFSYLVSDSELDSAPALVTVNILQPGFMGYSLGRDSSFRVQFPGATNATYSIWGSTNLLDWTVLGPASATNGGLFFYADELATNFPSRFYRVQTP